MLCEHLPNLVSDPFVLGDRERWKVETDYPGRAARKLGLGLPPSDEGIVERVAAPMRRKVEMQMRDAASEHVDLDQLGTGGTADRGTCPRQDLAERARFLAIQVGDVRYMPLGFEVR